MLERCEECARKHLAAALAHAVEASGHGDGDKYISSDSCMAFVGRAFVLYVESKCPNYSLHADLAKGFLVMAEQMFAQGFDGVRDTTRLRAARKARETEAKLMELGLFMSDQEDLCLMAGHLAEAKREGAKLGASYGATPDDFIKDYAAVVDRAFGKEGGE